MKAFVTAKVGVFLVISSVLAVWMLLAAQPVQAHSVTNPSCGSLPTADDFFTDTGPETVPLSAGGTVGDTTVTPKKGTGESGEGSASYYYAKITVPALTAGELSVSDNGNGPSEAYLCRGGTTVASSLPVYTTVHGNAESAANAADTAQTAAQTAADNTSISESAARNALRSAASALRNADDTANADIASGAADDADVARGVTVGTTPGVGTDNDSQDERIALGTAATALGTAATNLRTAATADAAHEGFDIMNAVISSGDEEYVVVVSVLEDATAPQLNVSFEGVMSTDAAAPDEGAFTQNNQRITHILMTTTATPGLLTVRTTGNEVDTIGTLNDGTNDIAMDEPSGSNFEIVTPVRGGVTYSLYVEGQTRGERGDYGLELEFGVADALTIGTSPADTVIERGRTDYFFFTVADATYSFLTVETQKHMDVTTETNTTGTLYSRDGLVTTDTNSGTGNNFLFRAPTSPGDYIVEVKGASSSTEGEYVLVTSSQTAISQGSAPDMVTGQTTGTNLSAGREVDPYSITVTTPGILQVKTTGMTDTVGVLYGPDGQQLATDDDSGDDTNFKITQAVEAGQHLVTVEGQTATTTGNYILVVNFLEGTDVDVPTPPVGPVDPPPTTVDPDPAGVLEEPPSGGVRSGIGLIRGWVCQDAGEGVQIRIANTDSRAQATTFTAPYGSDRGDVNVSEHCAESGRIVNGVGFAVQYNYNLLPAGTYTIQAFVGGERVGLSRPGGQTNTFTVARISDAEFLARVPSSSRVLVEDFPVRGTTTILEFDLSSQNFEIVGTQ